MSQNHYPIKLYEAFSIAHKPFLRETDGRPLGAVIDEFEGLQVSYAMVDGQMATMNWREYVPTKGQVIAVFPKVGPKKCEAQK